MKHHVYLVPGFFGFANLGELVYFGHVKDFLEEELARRGINADVHAVHSHPTASIPLRARDLLRALKDTAGTDGPLHLVGHSTGGLDSRLLVTPNVDLGGDSPEPFAARVRTVVSVSTPNLGTPLATFFNTFFGAQLLELLSVFTMYVLRFGRLPLGLFFRMSGVLVRLDENLGWKDTVLDQLFSQLLADFSRERREALTQFFSEVRQDRSLIPQLTAEGMDLFNPGCTDRPGVRYGSVLTQAKAPTVRSFIQTGVGPYAQLSHAVFSFFYARSSAFPAKRVRLPTLAQRLAIVRDLGGLPRHTASDGIVPTWSQLHGDVIRAVRADHLDVIGHFDGPTHAPPHVDWLISSSGFRRSDFVAVWTDVCDYLFGAPLPVP